MVLFFVSSCFWWETKPQADGLKIYDKNEAFSTRIPKKWEIIQDTKNMLPTPKTGKIELAVSSKVATDWVANSLVILSEELQNPSISSVGYAHSTFAKTKQDVSSIKNIQQKTISFGDGEDADISKVYIFDAKYASQTPRIRYLQTATICGKRGYLMTLSIPKNVKNTLKYEYMLSQFRCK